MKLSVVIPYFGVEEFIEECIVSLLDAWVPGVEFIFINDKTNDNSEKIVLKYQQLYPDKIINLVNKVNIGQGPSRNFGVANANGEWISFLDSDDIVYEDYCKVLLDNFNDDIDIIHFNHTVFKEGRISRCINALSEEAKKPYALQHYMWQKCIRKSVVEKVVQRRAFAEDYLAWFEILQISEKIKVIDNCIVGYRNRVTSDSNNLTEQKINELYDNTYAILEYGNFSSEVKGIIYKNIYYTILFRFFEDETKYQYYLNKNNEIMEKYFGSDWYLDDVVIKYENWVARNDITVVMYGDTIEAKKFNVKNSIIKVINVEKKTESFEELVKQLHPITTKFLYITNWNQIPNKEMIELFLDLHNSVDLYAFDDLSLLQEKNINANKLIFRSKIIEKSVNSNNTWESLLNLTDKVIKLNITTENKHALIIKNNSKPKKFNNDLMTPETLKVVKYNNKNNFVSIDVTSNKAEIEFLYNNKKRMSVGTLDGDKYIHHFEYPQERLISLFFPNEYFKTIKNDNKLEFSKVEKIFVWHQELTYVKFTALDIIKQQIKKVILWKK